ncbi:MAG: hypothetical protein AB8B69_25505 [Chitinophagales bacterium]
MQNNRTNLQKIHRASAMGLGIFILAHISNHLLAAKSIAWHIEVMNTLRMVYYQPIVEVLLILSILIQAFTGIQLYRKNRKHLHSHISKLQAYSGLYLSFFLVAHTTATVGGNWFFEVDTNFYFGASVLKKMPYVFFFVPYYFLSITAFFTHIACAMSKYTLKTNGLKAAYRLVYTFMALGTVCAIVILLAFSGVLHSFDLPEVYERLYP